MNHLTFDTLTDHRTDIRAAVESYQDDSRGPFEAYRANLKEELGLLDGRTEPRALWAMHEIEAEIARVDRAFAAQIPALASLETARDALRDALDVYDAAAAEYLAAPDVDALMRATAAKTIASRAVAPAKDAFFAAAAAARVACDRRLETGRAQSAFEGRSESLARVAVDRIDGWFRADLPELSEAGKRAARMAEQSPEHYVFDVVAELPHLGDPAVEAVFEHRWSRARARHGLTAPGAIEASAAE